MLEIPVQRRGQRHAVVAAQDDLAAARLDLEHVARGIARDRLQHEPVGVTGQQTREQPARGFDRGVGPGRAGVVRRDGARSRGW